MNEAKVYLRLVLPDRFIAHGAGYTRSHAEPMEVAVTVSDQEVLEALKPLYPDHDLAKKLGEMTDDTLTKLLLTAGMGKDVLAIQKRTDRIRRQRSQLVPRLIAILAEHFLKEIEKRDPIAGYYPREEQRAD